jgi:hypothetical protein
MPLTFKRFGILDAPLILALLLCAAFFLPVLSSHAPATVVVYKDNAAIATYPLTDDCAFSISGARGIMKVKIKHGAVYVDSATCPEQLCVRTKPASQAFQQIICEPNHIVIEITSSKKAPVDAVSK